MSRPEDPRGFDETLAATPSERRPRSGDGDGDGDDDADELAAGARLGGRYLITGFLGRGGMGAVYQARDEALDGKVVALKLVSRRLAGTGGVDRLRNEVLLAQKVTHPGVCRTYDLEEADGRWLVKMEHVAGQTLARHMAAGPLPVDDVLVIARQIAEALGAAHKQGVVHRDLKPANVMIEEGSERVVLMDFGIARPAERSGDTADEIVGTPDYMAPEQVRAEAVDGRTDLYALGCVIYHLLAGEVVFPARTPMAAGLRHVEDTPPDLGERRSDVPDWLARAVRRLLAKDPADRPADAAAALALLAGPPRRGRRWLAIAAVAALATAAAVVLLVSRRGGEPAAAPPAPALPAWHPVVVEPQPAYDENGENPVISPDGTLIAMPGDREQTGQFRIYVSPLAGGPPRAITPPEMNAVGAHWTHDGRALLVSDATTVIGTWRFWLDAHAPPERVSNSGRVQDCNGRWLSQLNGTPDCDTCQALILREPDGREHEVHRLPPGEALIDFRCDRAGTQVVYARARDWSLSPQSDLWLVSVEGGRARRLTSDGLRNSRAVFHPDGKSIVFSSARGGPTNLWELPLAGGEPVRITVDEGDDLGADISADGKNLVFDVDITWKPLFARTAGAAARRLTTTRPVLEAPSATADGSEIIASEGATGGRTRIVAISTRDGSQRVIADGTMGDATPDGTEIVYATLDVPAQILARPRAGGPPRTLGSAPLRVVGLRVGPDGWVYLELLGTRVAEPWRIPLQGGQAERAAEAPTCVVMPAPSGRFLLRAQCTETRGFLGEIVAIKGGVKLARKVQGQRGAFDPRGTSFVYATEREVRRLDLVTGKDVSLFPETNLVELTVGPDGTVYYTQTVGRVRRQLITNFGDRPRP